MKRDFLEKEITKAIDGELDRLELNKLETELEKFPDMRKDYQVQKSMRSLSGLYGSTQGHRDKIKTVQIKAETAWPFAGHFETISIQWFKRYLAAAAMILIILSGISNSDQFSDIDRDVTEFVYPSSEELVDSYVLYLDELIGVNETLF